MTDPHAPLAARAARLARLGGERFDVLVIGGGITGAGVARDAAMRGLRTALVERDDFAAGTSSRSSRLVHGGVRYLEHGYLHLVFESSRERRTLLRIAPHLVRPLPFTWPVYRGARLPRWKLGAGLFLYDALAAFRNVGRHRRLGAEGVLAREPALAREGLVGGASYFDASTDDARLTLANALAAGRSGAVVLNHVEAIAFVREGDRVTGARVRDRLGNAEIVVHAAIVVNAAGPWTDEVRRLETPTTHEAMRGTKGVHVAVPAARVGNRDAITLTSPADGRVMFVLPGDGQTIVGTTDTPTAAHPAEVRASREDVRYLLDSVNRYFPAAALGERDVIAAWAGIRPLVAASWTGDPASASREHLVERSPSGVVHVSGGKLTTYRAMAADVVDTVERALGRTPHAAPTDRTPLPGGDFPSLDALATSLETELPRRVLDGAAVARHLARAYGTESRAALSRCRDEPALAEPLAPGHPHLAAEVVHALEREQACTIADVLVRRTHLAFELADGGASLAPRVAALMGDRLGWHASARDRAVDDYAREVARLFTVDP